jgi:RecG-like helicase
MKNVFFLLCFAVFISSCEVTETLIINPDNSGTIKYEQHREENSYMQIAGDSYSQETIFVDTSYVFKEYITNYNANFIKYTQSEQELFSRFENVKVHIKKSAFDKEYSTTIRQDFKKVEDIADLTKTEDYADDLKHNYALTAEEHYYSIRYTLTNNKFNRVVSITNEAIFKNEKEKIANYKKQLAGYNLVQTYLLAYHFPRKIKAISNSRAVISSDKKSLELRFSITDFLEDPTSTNLQVEFE